MKTRWFLWAVNDDPDTNDYLVQVVGVQRADSLRQLKFCADGQPRNLFDCPEGYVNVRSAIAGISRFNLKIEVFKEEADGRVIRYDLWKPLVQKASLQSRLRRYRVHRAA